MRARTLIAFVSTATLLIGCRGNHEAPPAEPPAAVRTLAVRTEAVDRTITSTGTLEPPAKVIVAAQEEGLVTAVRVREGDRVSAGQVLIELDARELGAQLAEEEARRVESEAQWRRIAALVAQGLLPEAQADTARATFETAAARVDALRTRLSFTRVTAPVDGVVTARRVEVGNLATARGPLLELAAGDGLILRVPVSELDVVSLAAGDPVTVTVDALPGARVPARIARIFPAADSASRQVTVEIALDTVPVGVRPGFLARAALVIERLPAAVMIPDPALLRGAEVPFFVYVVDSGRAAVRPVTPGDHIAGRTLVRAGLQPGDEVIVEGMGRLRAGAPVRATSAERPR